MCSNAWFVQNILQFNGQFGCGVCLYEGIQTRRGRGYAKTYPFKSDVPHPRTKENMRMYADEACKRGKHVSAGCCCRVKIIIIIHHFLAPNSDHHHHHRFSELYKVSPSTTIHSMFGSSSSSFLRTLQSFSKHHDP